MGEFEIVEQEKAPLDRRGFLKSLGGGLLILLAVDEQGEAQESGNAGHHGRELPANVSAWLHIDGEGMITAFTGKVEVGQNARTSLTQAVADELRCLPSAVRMVMGDTALTPWDAGTFGSRTTPTMTPQMRKMAATAREMLAKCAAQRWGVDQSTVQVRNARVLHAPSGRHAGHGELSAKIDWAGVIGSADQVTPASEWKVAGKSERKINGGDIVCGKHRYTSDLKMPGMLFGRVLRPPSPGAKLIAVNTDAASRMPGVTVVRDGDFIGVTATDEAKAQKALAAVEPRWETTARGSNQELFRDLQAQAKAQTSGGTTANAGDRVLECSYTVAYIAHVPLEPRAALVVFTPEGVTVHAGTQRPFGVREEVARAFNLPETKVRVLVPDTGSGYGGKHTGEYAVEAARLAKATGKPVKLIWTREEEFTSAYFRPAGLITINSAMASDGTLRAWECHNYMSGPSGLETPYEVATKSGQFHKVDSPLREGSYRGLASAANHFARESHMDELAAAAGVDPLQFRLDHLKDERLRIALQTAATHFDWKQGRSSKERGYGLACGVEKGGHIACCVEVSIGVGKQLRVERVVAAWDCGAVVNPDGLRNQVEGAILMGLGGALFEQINFENGQVLNPRLSEYRVPRFSDTPEIEVLLIDRKDIAPAGAGEIPIVAIAPAIANAIFSATHVRLRSLPLLPAFHAS